MSNLRYEEVEPQFIGLIKLKARNMAAKGVGEFDDLFQEGRIHAARCVETFDEGRLGRGGLVSYIGFVLDNEYKNMAASAFAAKRVPRVWTLDTDTGEWEKVAERPMSLDRPQASFDAPDGDSNWVESVPAEGEQGMTPEELHEWSEQEGEVKAIVIHLMAALNKRQRRVLKAMVSPDWDMYAMVRNLTGEATTFKVTKRHIAMYLGLTYGQVENDAAAIRRAARTLLKERGYDID